MPEQEINKKINYNQILMYASLFLFSAITIPKLINHIPWFDENLAWILMRELDFNNIVTTFGSQGFLFVWPLLLLPFAKLNLFFPYYMLWLNWLIYFLAIYVMWKKAPFGNIAKIIITFGFMSLNYFPIVARCYSIGVLGLFLLASMYKEQTKPENIIKYALLLVLTANTSLLAGIAIAPLAMIFIYNLIKEKRKIKAPLSLLCLGGFLFVFPALITPEAGKIIDFSYYKILIEIAQETHFVSFFCFLFLSVLLLVFTDNKIKFLFSFILIEFFTFFSCLYPPFRHLTIFLIVYLIFIYWLTPKLHYTDKKSAVFLIVFCVLLNLPVNFDYALKDRFEEKEMAAYLESMKDQKYCVIASWRNSDIFVYLKEYGREEMPYKCSINVECATDFVKNYLKNNDFYKTAYLISGMKINDDSVVFYGPEDSFIKEQYITKFTLEQTKDNKKN